MVKIFLSTFNVIYPYLISSIWSTKRSFSLHWFLTLIFIRLIRKFLLERTSHWISQALLRCDVQRLHFSPTQTFFFLSFPLHLLHQPLHIPHIFLYLVTLTCTLMLKHREACTFSMPWCQTSEIDLHWSDQQSESCQGGVLLCNTTSVWSFQIATLIYLPCKSSGSDGDTLKSCADDCALKSFTASFVVMLKLIVFTLLWLFHPVEGRGNSPHHPSWIFICILNLTRKLNTQEKNRCLKLGSFNML